MSTHISVSALPRPHIIVVGGCTELKAMALSITAVPIVIILLIIVENPISE
jgi:hypothetical protein